MVAENSRVWRDLGSFEQISSMSGMNPMSSIRSASSMTSRLQSLSMILPRPNRSIRRPGVAISTSTPFASALTWSPICTPPMSKAIESGWYLPYFSKFSATCIASSRVGSRISERGIRARLRPSCKISIIGSTKPAVLPVPVWAMPMRSLPISTDGIAARWIGVGSSYPLSLTARSNSSERPRSAKVIQYPEKRVGRGFFRPVRNCRLPASPTASGLSRNVGAMPGDSNPHWPRSRGTSCLKRSMVRLPPIREWIASRRAHNAGHPAAEGRNPA